MNNDERREWIMNDECLYNWFMSVHNRYHGQSMTEFIKENRQEIDEYINKQLNRKGAYNGR